MAIKIETHYCVQTTQKQAKNCQKLSKKPEQKEPICGKQISITILKTFELSWEIIIKYCF